MKPSRSVVALLAIGFLALHLPYLPSSLEDVDSINFALGIHEFDVARHQPHPPGYPIYIAAAKASRMLVSSDAKALALLSALAGALGVLAIAALHRRLRPGDAGTWAAAAAAVAVTSPLYWLTSVRPLSDVVGLTAAVAVQAIAISAASGRALMLAAFLAGLAAGIRSQVVWLTVPLLAVMCTRWRSTGESREQEGGRGAAARIGGRQRRPVLDTREHYGASASARGGGAPRGLRNAGAWLATGAAFAAGLTLWFAPLVVLTGGPAAYWRAVVNQGAEDLSGVQMLWTRPTVRELLSAMYYAFVAPWGAWPIAVIVVAFAVAGIVLMARHDRWTLGLLTVAFGPYLVFDVLFQETFTSRYALPLVIPLAFLAVRGVRVFRADVATAVVIALAMLDAHLGGRSIAAYARQPAPAFRMLADMQREISADSALPLPVLAPDRRESFDLRRPLSWLGGAGPRFERQLAAPPQHEWLQAVKYWNGGGRGPLWFVVDPRRSAIDLVQHGEPIRYRWSMPLPVLLSGTRPNDADWYRVDRPEWYVAEGWSLTPESAGVGESDRRGLRYGSIDGWVDRKVFNGGAIVIGGRNFEPSDRPRVTLIAEQVGWSLTKEVAPGPFADIVRLPVADFSSTVPEFVKLTVSASRPSRVAIEQFDASASRAVVAFGDGWHEPEYDPPSGRRWRWLSGRAELRYVTGPGEWKLHIEGESPRKYYRRDSHIVLRSGDATLDDVTASDDFSIDVPVPPAFPAASTIVIETDQTHVPADTSWRGSQDRRRLGLRIFKCELRRR